MRIYYEIETNNLSPPKTSLFTEVINFLKRLLKKVVSNYYVYILIDSFYELPRNLLLSREYKQSKMKETNLNDIPKIVNKLNRIVYKKRKKILLN